MAFHNIHDLEWIRTEEWETSYHHRIQSNPESPNLAINERDVIDDEDENVENSIEIMIEESK